MSTPATPSTRAWCVLLTSAKRLRSRPCTSQSSQSGFERSSACENTPPRDVLQLLLGPGRRKRGVAHVVGEVEVGVVDPERSSRLHRRERQLLAESRYEVQAAAHVVEEVVVARRRALEDQDGADVHVAVGALVRQERGVDRRQSVEMGLHRIANPIRAGPRPQRRSMPVGRRGEPGTLWTTCPPLQRQREPGPRRSCWRRLAATARASIAPCRRWSTPSTSTARRSTSARRSCTTSTSSIS